MATKKTTLGKVQKNVQGYNIRTVPQYNGKGYDRKITSSTFGVFKGKKMIQDGFKNKDKATDYINNNLI